MMTYGRVYHGYKGPAYKELRYLLRFSSNFEFIFDHPFLEKGCH